MFICISTGCGATYSNGVKDGALLCPNCGAKLLTPEQLRNLGQSLANRKTPAGTFFALEVQSIMIGLEAMQRASVTARKYYREHSHAINGPEAKTIADEINKTIEGASE